MNLNGLFSPFSGLKTRFKSDEGFSPRRRLCIAAITTAAVLYVGLCLPAAAQSGSAEPIAALTNGDLWLYALDGTPREITINGSGVAYGQPFWSPNGALLGITASDDTGRSLLISDFNTALLVNVARGLHPTLPPAFSADGAQVIYAAPVLGSDQVQVFSYAPSAASAPVQIGAFNYSDTCGGGLEPLVPTEQRYRLETQGSLYAKALLAPTPFGVLHNTRCQDIDLWLLNPQNAQDTLIFPAVDGVFVSPDQTRVVVVNGGVLSFVNTPAGPYTQITPAAPPDQVGFGLAGSNEIFYSTRASVGVTPLPDGVAEALGSVFFQMPVSYEVSIHRFSLRTGRDDLLYTADAYGIGNLVLSADGGTLVFNQIPNADAWVNAIASGALQPGDDGLGYVEPEIYALNLADNSARLLGQGWSQFALNAAVDIVLPDAPLATPMPPTLTPIPRLPTATYPPTLTPRPEGFEAPTESPTGISIGANMTISTEVGTMNTRQRPGTGERVVELMFGGERVLVLDGPVDDLEGFRWWKIRMPSTAEGWIAERINGVQTLVPANE